MAMIDDPRRRWQLIYQTKVPSDLSWYQPIPQQSMEFVRSTCLPPDSPILDVGGGTSTFVDHLLAAGFTDITVLDLVPAALVEAEVRLGAAACRVHWIAEDITAWRPVRRYRLWHDRAVFHFLVDPALRARYVDVLRAALAAHGHVVMATFGPNGPTHCSGLDVKRYSAHELSAVLGPSFLLVRSQIVEHITPAGRTQEFLYGWWQAQA
ncbi:MAG: class I SAM-dependent methyltransferase [Planctomycetia bacterium]|nr:class I SAM-dependent methyltransferase [Candidatus Brocadia sp.]MDG6006407.1 class I SAM-dependent methyltransferase [Candidatus Brocadia sp.]QOJ05318.1 MAG: class I SAM-dependent methyltransferase [Planctomycetia bacterium]HQU32082.1 class I SAM-dependent methyltransferase [Candidatus Brocadia sapporoensis]